MYFTRLIHETANHEFRLERFERFEHVAFAGISPGLRDKDEFQAIRLSADRERHIGFLDPLGDPEIARKWIEIMNRVSNKRVEQPENNWIAYFRTEPLLSNTEKSVDVVICEQETSDPTDAEAFGAFFDEVVKKISAEHSKGTVISIGVSELKNFMRFVWEAILSGLIT